MSVPKKNKFIGDDDEGESMLRALKRAEEEAMSNNRDDYFVSEGTEGFKFSKEKKESMNMAALGKSLVFYFKFWYEMQSLFEKTAEGELEGLQDREKTLRMVTAVGTKAYEQAGEFLEACATVIQAQFEEIGRCKRIPTPGRALEKSWSLSFGIWPHGSRVREGNWKMQAGVEILKSEKPAIVPWIWRQGGVQAEETLVAVLTEKLVKARGQEWDLKAGIGSVALDRIPLLPDNLDGFDIDRGPLIKRVQQAFSGFSQNNLKVLWPG